MYVSQWIFMFSFCFALFWFRFCKNEFPNKNLQQRRKNINRTNARQNEDKTKTKRLAFQKIVLFNCWTNVPAVIQQDQGKYHFKASYNWYSNLTLSDPNNDLSNQMLIKANREKKLVYQQILLDKLDLRKVEKEKDPNRWNRSINGSRSHEAA